MNTPDQKIFVMEGSLRVFSTGLLSLVPPFGLVCAPLALWRFFSVWSVAGKEWNPARRQLYLGMWAAFVGGFLSVVTLLIVIAIINNGI
ncbi:hypothetical protein GC207_15430 [bacterium]|nr:hypothetical protein [bacterium]